jgi:hypothetical protein
MDFVRVAPARSPMKESLRLSERLSRPTRQTELTGRRARSPRKRRSLDPRPRGSGAPLAFSLIGSAISISPMIPVEIWFNIITQKPIRRWTFRSMKDLAGKIDYFVQHSNVQARPFVWTARADSILEKVKRLCQHICETEYQQVQ